MNLWKLTVLLCLTIKYTVLLILENLCKELSNSYAEKGQAIVGIRGTTVQLSTTILCFHALHSLANPKLHREGVSQCAWNAVKLVTALMITHLRYRLLACHLLLCYLISFLCCFSYAKEVNSLVQTTARWPLWISSVIPPRKNVEAVSLHQKRYPISPQSLKWRWGQKKFQVCERSVCGEKSEFSSFVWLESLWCCFINLPCKLFSTSFIQRPFQTQIFTDLIERNQVWNQDEGTKIEPAAKFLQSLKSCTLI